MSVKNSLLESTFYEKTTEMMLVDTDNGSWPLELAGTSVSGMGQPRPPLTAAPEGSPSQHFDMDMQYNSPLVCILFFLSTTEKLGKNSWLKFGGRRIKNRNPDLNC